MQSEVDRYALLKVFLFTVVSPHASGMQSLTGSLQIFHREVTGTTCKRYSSDGHTRQQHKIPLLIKGLGSILILSRFKKETFHLFDRFVSRVHL